MSSRLKTRLLNILTQIELPSSNRLLLDVLILSLALFTFSFLVVHNLAPYDSDATAQQAAISQISFTSHLNILLPPDNFVIKLPFYALMELVPFSARTRLLTSSVILNVIGFLVFFWSLRYFLRTFTRNNDHPNMVAVVWLASLGLSFVSLLINPNTRNIELGLMFGILAAIHKYDHADFLLSTRRHVMLAVGFIALVGLFIFNDPFFIYLLIAPVLILFGARLIWLGRNRRVEIVILAVLGSIVAMAVWRFLFSLIGIHAGISSAAFATPDTIAKKTVLLVTGLPSLFSADFLGRAVFSLESLRRELNAAVLIGTLLAPLLLFKRSVRLNLWMPFFLFQPLLVLLAFTGSNVTIDASTMRYLILLPFYAVFIWSIYLLECSNPRLRWLIIAGFVLSAALNVGSLVDSYRHRGPNPNEDNYAVVHAVAARGLTKGYATYWNAPLNTYLSDNRIVFIQAGCGPKVGLLPYYWLLNEQAFARPATKTFYLLQPASTHCTQDDLIRFLGTPSEIATIDDQTTLFVFDHDITRDIVKNR